MGLTYFKRFRMEFDLDDLPATGDEPKGYRMVPWNDGLLHAHADTKYQSFCFELDANVFPCLGDREGCRRLMGEISRRPGFVQEATWLMSYSDSRDKAPEYCGTIQGVCDRHGTGWVQNLGITPPHRGRKLGTKLLFKSLAGFRTAGLRRGALEVTAQNTGALRLYQRLGFRTVKTVYKAVDVEYA